MRGAIAREVVWRQLFCRGSGCGVMFYICGSCYRGQVYCGDKCRRRMRRQQMRRANRKHQDSPEGQLDHRDRQRAYRERCRLRRVTDHTSAGHTRSGNIEEPLTETGIRPSVAGGFHDRPRFGRPRTAIRPVCTCVGVWARRRSARRGRKDDDSRKKKHMTGRSTPRPPTRPSFTRL